MVLLLFICTMLRLCYRSSKKAEFPDLQSRSPNKESIDKIHTVYKAQYPTKACCMVPILEKRHPLYELIAAVTRLNGVGGNHLNRPEHRYILFPSLTLVLPFHLPLYLSIPLTINAPTHPSSLLSINIFHIHSPFLSFTHNPIHQNKTHPP